MMAPIAAGRLFLLVIGGATVGPTLIGVLEVSTGGGLHFAGGIRLLQLLAGPHVFTTLYLFLDSRDYAGIPRPAITLLAIPAALLGLNWVMLMTAPMSAVMAYMVFFIYFTIWHFGRQNYGVVSFATRVSHDRPLALSQRRAIAAGNIAGALGAYHAYAPAAFTLKRQVWPIDLSAIDPIFSRLWYGGIAIYALLVPIVCYDIARRWRNEDPGALLVYGGCVFFFAPIYLSANPLISLVTWSVAHGMQYLVILTFHAAGRAQGRDSVRVAAPFVLFGLCLMAGVGLWLVAGRFQSRGTDFETKLAVATLNGLTIVHYWVERFLWRFSIPERRKWMEASFSFLVRRKGHAEIQGALAREETL